ncbi:protein kinase [Lysinibacillus fusiformis]|uniref:serine/threonine-protein kinase n=1 Tax=Lysinibacillus TaxID=400634 RepID=UPI00073859D2|nr:protein kinase [Lysinibacillus sp. F5]KUF36285.1 serine/threonine protein kinase [Lysinibacillus sp. F5]MEE3806824.1 protein kinase [Lysinibacillus fusiformis]
MWWKRLSEKGFDQAVAHYIGKHPNFSFKKLLGYGAYGRAYLIEDCSSKLFVLKCLRPKHRHHKKTIQKFKQEIHILQQVSLPYVPTIHSTGTIQESPFFIMDYVNGQTFEQLIFEDGAKFTVVQSLAITKQLLEQIIELHNHGIVHRDLRIPNILLVHQQLHIIDFGLATTYQKHIDLSAIENPKRAENHISDLYFVGHFLLFLLYSDYKPSKRKEQAWQQELKLPIEVKDFLERLLWIQDPFNSALEAWQSVPSFTH